MFEEEVECAAEDDHEGGGVDVGLDEVGGLGLTDAVDDEFEDLVLSRQGCGGFDYLLFKTGPSSESDIGGVVLEEIAEGEEPRAEEGGSGGVAGLSGSEEGFRIDLILGQAGDDALLDGKIEVALGVEVMVNQGFRCFGYAGDFGHGGTGETAIGKELLGGIEDAGTGLFGLLLAGGGCFGGLIHVYLFIY